MPRVLRMGNLAYFLCIIFATKGFSLWRKYNIFAHTPPVSSHNSMHFILACKLYNNS
ncbi:hypothetical protein SCFA_430013 [anaerobic digester metagenome]|uniref:Uncharacterized protein n=1 Tax=anaerobic digester metagenome TaxID=1263854 RepID=A0A485M250_9ZZZZ